MTDTNCAGWKNRSTFAANLWLEREIELRKSVQENLQAGKITADQAAWFVQNHITNLVEHVGSKIEGERAVSVLISDLLTAALSGVDWKEIAGRLQS